MRRPLSSSNGAPLLCFREFCSTVGGGDSTGIGVASGVGAGVGAGVGVEVAIGLAKFVTFFVTVQ